MDAATEWDQENVREEYSQLRQLDNEALMEYREKFTAAVRACVIMGISKPDDLSQATHFLHRQIDDMIQDFKKHTKTMRATSWNYVVPKNLDEAFAVAAKYVNAWFKTR